MRRPDWRGIDSFNALSETQAVHALYACCSSRMWAVRVAAARPFADERALLDQSDLVLTELTDTDLDEALDGHPRIGDRPTDASSTREQRNVTDADPAVLEELRTANRTYEEKFGHVYLVHADGRPADELLRILRRRLHNDPDTERRVLRLELAKITRSRLSRMICPAAQLAEEAG
jgi:2-oxo-4-hydroxy-4-carboxy-5-ureidoimidazoline decarboxylase